MGTEVIRPQDFLRLNTSSSSSAAVLPRRKPYNQNQRVGRKSDQKRRVMAVAQSADMVMERVTILKRGEDLAKFKNKNEGGAVVVPRRIRVEERKPVRSGPIEQVYAGSAVVMSPSPRALPLPSFSKTVLKKKKEEEFVDDSATKDLRRLLGLK